MTDPVGLARNGLAALESREAIKALEFMRSEKGATAFGHLVLAMCLMDIGDAEAAMLAVAALAAAPAMILHLCPWLCRGNLTASNISGTSLQVAISLRQFRRSDLKGWAARSADAAGILLPDGSPCLPREHSPGEGALCLIDGKRVPDIDRHVRLLGVSPRDYREFFGLSRPEAQGTLLAHAGRRH